MRLVFFGRPLSKELVFIRWPKLKIALFDAQFLVGLAVNYACIYFQPCKKIVSGTSLLISSHVREILCRLFL